MNILKIIFAYSTDLSDNLSECAFGLNNGLPWAHNTEDLKQFKEFTKDSILLMGARTFESLPRKLPNRKHAVLTSDYVVTKNGELPDEIFHAIKLEFVILELLEQGDVTIIGGPALIESCIQYANVVRMTEIHQDNDFDVSINVNKIKTLLCNHACETTDYDGFSVSEYKWGMK